MSDDMPMWKGLFEWSMNYQDGTVPSSQTLGPMAEEDRRWLEDALKGAMVDLSKRMECIKTTLDAAATAAATDATSNTESNTPESLLEESERLLDELLDLVDSIDQARDLSTIGGLSTLLSLLQSPRPSLQWRAAEVAATCVQNNPEVQATFMEGGVLPILWDMLDHESVTCRIKGLLAMSCMLRGCAPAVRWFLREKGVEKLIDMLSNGGIDDSGNGGDVEQAEGENSEIPTASVDTITEQMQQENAPTTAIGVVDARLQRKCWQVMTYIFHCAPMYRTPALLHNSHAIIHRLEESILSDDGDVRSSALAVGLELSKEDDCLRIMQGSTGLIEAVQELQCRLDVLDKEDWPGVEEEVDRAKQLAVALAKELPAPAARGSSGGGVEGVARDLSGMQIVAVPQQTQPPQIQPSSSAAAAEN